jgi:2-polyprenyl-3-methyl-5-hydroxy-6-metoxy-1,4-benzoquinol methylase
MIELFSKRMEAAMASKGTSSAPVRDLALAICEKYPRGNLLDYGSGVGDLLLEIAGRLSYPSLAGVDIMDRPAELPADIGWFSQDLNIEFDLEREFDVVVSTEVIEHLENPRATIRNIEVQLISGPNFG